MNQIANKSQSRPTLPRVVAKLDLADENQRRLHDLIARMHGGRHPTLRALAIRQIGNVLHEAVEWVGRSAPLYSVVTYQPDGFGLSWRDTDSEAAARALLKSLR